VITCAVYGCERLDVVEHDAKLANEWLPNPKCFTRGRLTELPSNIQAVKGRCGGSKLENPYQI
jgi:hypothetical protein